MQIQRKTWQIQRDVVAARNLKTHRRRTLVAVVVPLTLWWKHLVLLIHHKAADCRCRGALASLAFAFAFALAFALLSICTRGVRAREGARENQRMSKRIDLGLEFL